MFFLGDSANIEHLNWLKSLPVWNADAKIDPSIGIFATEKAFRDVLTKYAPKKQSNKNAEGVQDA